MTIDMSQFYEVFFDEAEELLAEAERLLLSIDMENPDAEDLNAIFRAAHSIKGGAATFGFMDMTEITHLKNAPWERTKNTKGLKKKIDYLLALDDSPESLTEEVVLERMKEIAEMKTLFKNEKRNNTFSPTV